MSAFLFSNSSLLLGSTARDTLNLVEQDAEAGHRPAEVGYRLSVPAEPHGRRLATLLEQATHEPRACIHLRVSEDEWTADDNGRALRTIKRMTLFSVDPEVRPQY